MKKLLLLFIIAITLNASIVDEAKRAYEKGDFNKAAKLYSKLAKDEKAKFNLGDSLYKAKRYQEALNVFKSINSKELQFKKLYNMGNCYANLKRFDDAIKMYKEALKIKDDKDARFNLELIKKLKKKNQQKNKKQNKTKNQSKQSKNNQNQNNNKQNNKQSKNNNNQKNNQKQNQAKQNKNQNKQNQTQNKKNQKNQESTQKNNQEQNQTQKQQIKQNQKKDTNKAKLKEHNIDLKRSKNEPISDMEIRKWNKVLNQLNIHTLMLPIQTKGKDSEKNPW